jgi:hypothetical protein
MVFFLGFQTGQHQEFRDSGPDTNLSDLVPERNNSSSLHGDKQVRRGLPDSHLGSRTVGSVSSYRVNRYEISLKTEDGDQYLRENGWSGYTWGNGSIVVKSGMSVSWTYDVCRHEVKHNLYPELNHSEMSEKTSSEARNTCLELLYVAD